MPMLPTYLAKDDTYVLPSFLPVPDVPAPGFGKLMVNSYLIKAKEPLLIDAGMPIGRVDTRNPGDTFTDGDWEFTIRRPPLFDSPATAVYFDTKTKVLFCADSFGAIIPDVAELATDVPDSAFYEDFSIFNRLNHPWFALVHQSKFEATMESIRRLEPDIIAGCHAPLAKGPRMEAHLQAMANLPAQGRWTCRIGQHWTGSLPRYREVATVTESVHMSYEITMLGQRTRLSDKVAIVTGAGATGSGDFVGIGQATSILFARAGAKVLLVDRDQANAESTLATIKEEGGTASVFVGDVTNNADCKGMADAAVERYGLLNVLVNNVGISGPGSVTDVDEEFWDTVIDVNLKSVMLTSKHAIPQMIEAGGGSIINLSSIVGLRAGSGRPSHPYAASKGGIIGLSNSMAVHYGRNNVRVNCIAPGHIHSPMVARHSTQEMLDLRRRAGPLGTDGTPWDVAWAALFLASDEARWISGVTLPVDAGLLAATPLAMYPYLQDSE